MSIELLTEFEIQNASKEIVYDLVKLTPSDAFKVLHQALGQVIKANLNTDYAKPESLMYPYNPVLKRRKQQMKVDADPELKAFIHSLKTYHSTNEIVALCVKKFGKKRAPSKSSLGRYFQRLKNPNISFKEPLK